MDWFDIVVSAGMANTRPGQAMINERRAPSSARALQSKRWFIRMKDYNCSSTRVFKLLLLLLLLLFIKVLLLLPLPLCCSSLLLCLFFGLCPLSFVSCFCCCCWAYATPLTVVETYERPVFKKKIVLLSFRCFYKLFLVSFISLCSS